MKMRTLKAYEVREGYEGHCVIRFATNSATARREGAAELYIDWEGVEGCTRKPAFDAYAPGPGPKLVLLEHGWWMECHHCMRRIDLDDDSEEDEDGQALPSLAPVESGSAIFCNPECQARQWAERRANAAARTAMCELIWTRFPEARIKRVHVYGERLEQAERSKGVLVGGIKSLAEFELPGIQHGVTYHFGEPFFYVATADAEAFKAAYGLNPS